MRIELPSKCLGETVNQTVDFVSRLAAGELINAAAVTGSLYSGNDPSPSSIVNGAAAVSGSKVTQSLTGGVLGNIYEVCYTVITSLGQTLEITGYFAVVPDLP